MSIRQLPEVDADIDAAAAWYDQQQPGLGNDFIDAVAAGQAVIEQSPRASDSPGRRSLVARFAVTTSSASPTRLSTRSMSRTSPCLP